MIIGMQGGGAVQHKARRLLFGLRQENGGAEREGRMRASLMTR
jgi:hypothetical protein